MESSSYSEHVDNNVLFEIKSKGFILTTVGVVFAPFLFVWVPFIPKLNKKYTDCYRTFSAIWLVTIILFVEIFSGMPKSPQRTIPQEYTAPVTHVQHSQPARTQTISNDQHRSYSNPLCQSRWTGLSMTNAGSDRIDEIMEEKGCYPQ